MRELSVAGGHSVQSKVVVRTPCEWVRRLLATEQALSFRAVGQPSVSELVKQCFSLRIDHYRSRVEGGRGPAALPPFRATVGAIRRSCVSSSTLLPDVLEHGTQLVHATPSRWVRACRQMLSLVWLEAYYVRPNFCSFLNGTTTMKSRRRWCRLLGRLGCFG